MRYVLKSKPRRVLMSADTVGGVWTYSLELARGLARHGTRVFLATMGAELTRDQMREARSVHNLKILESRFKLEWMDDAWHDVRAAGDWLLGLEREYAPNLVHLNGYSHAALPWKAPVLVAAHSCVCSWWLAVKGEEAPAAWDTYREHVRNGLAAANMVIAPSEAMLSSLEQHYGPFANGRVIPNGLDGPHASTHGKEPIIFSAGRLWDEAKNVSLLTAIADELPWPVYIAGETRQPEGETRQFPNVTHLGRLSSRELAPWFAKASICALPARYEPFGLSALEAALAECALVLGDIPSLREIWNDAAVYVSPSDPEHLKKELRDLIADSERRREMAARARERAGHYAGERMTVGHLEAYSELLHRTSVVPDPDAEEVSVCAS